MDILVPLTENHEYKRVYARGKSAVRRGRMSCKVTQCWQRKWESASAS